VIKIENMDYQNMKND